MSYQGPLSSEDSIWLPLSSYPQSQLQPQPGNSVLTLSLSLRRQMSSAGKLGIPMRKGSPGSKYQLCPEWEVLFQMLAKERERKMRRKTA